MDNGSAAVLGAMVGGLIGWCSTYFTTAELYKKQRFDAAITRFNSIVFKEFANLDIIVMGQDPFKNIDDVYPIYKRIISAVWEFSTETKSPKCCMEIMGDLEDISTEFSVLITEHRKNLEEDQDAARPFISKSSRQFKMKILPIIKRYDSNNFPDIARRKIAEAIQMLCNKKESKR